MTIETFVEKLKSTPRDWRLERSRIRRGDIFDQDKRQCPVIAVAGENWSMRNSITLASQTLQLAQEDFWNILDAADGNLFDSLGVEKPGKLSSIRAQLLEACGLKEEE